MARVRVAVADVERGDLPAVCAKTGRPCANAVALTLRPGRHLWSPGRRSVVAVVPLDAGRVAEHRVLTRATWVLLAGFVAALAATLTVAGGLAFGAAAAVLAVYVALVVAGDARWIGAARAEDAGDIVLTRVHAAFARAVDAQYGRDVSR